MAYNFKSQAKITAMTLGEVGVVGGSMILTSKFLDFNVLFKNQIAADPNYANKFHIKHQGAIKLVVGALAAAHIKNPWLKLLAIGVAVEGFIREVRVLTTDSAGTAFFDKIGNSNSQQNAEADARLLEIAKKMEMSGPPLTTDYGSTVGNAGVMTLSESYPQFTAGPISREWGSTVGQSDGILREVRFAS